MTDHLDLSADIDPDGLTDDELMVRVATCRHAGQGMDACRGLAIIGGAYWDEDKKLAAFLGIFHPEIDADTVRRLGNDVRRRAER